MADPIRLVDPKTGNIFEAADEEMAQRQQLAYGLDRATDDQTQTYVERERTKGLVSNLKVIPETLGGMAAEGVEAASRFIPQVDAEGRPIDRITRAEQVAPFAYTPEAKERRRVHEGTALATTIAADVATSALIPSYGLGGMLASAAASGLLTEASTTLIQDDEYSLKDAALASGSALAFEGVGAAAFKGAMRVHGKARSYLDSAVERARRAAAVGAEAETDTVRAAEALRRNSEELYTKHQTTLDEALAAIDERTAGAPERMFTTGALKKTVSQNLGAQEEAFFDLAVKLDQAAQVSDVPGIADVAKTMQEGLGKNGAGMFDAMRKARQQLDTLGASASPLVNDAAEALDASLRSQPTWGMAAKNYSDVADDIGSASDNVTVNLREANARDVLDQRLDRARRMAALTNDQKLKNALRTAEEALEGADKVTGARILGESTPDDIAKLQKQVDGFAARAPKLGKELHGTYGKLNKTLDGTLGEMSEDAALDYVAARASGIGGKTDVLREAAVKAEKQIAAMKARGADPRKIAKATSELRDLREAMSEIHEIPRATQRIRDWEARPQPGKGFLGRIANRVGGAADDIVVEELQNAIQPMLHGAGMTVGLHAGGIPGAALGYLGGRAINKAFGERIARWVWKRSKQGAIEFAKKSPLEAAGAAAGAVGGAYMGPKGVIGGAIAGRNVGRRVGERAQSLSRRLWKQTQKTVAEEGERRAARSVGAAAADPKRGPIGEYVRDAAIRADEALEDLEKLGKEKLETTAETAAKAWEATQEAAKGAGQVAAKVSEADVVGAAASAAKKARHVAADAVSAAVGAAQKAGAKAPEIAAAARQVAQSARKGAVDVAKAATTAAKKAGAIAGDVSRAATEAAEQAAGAVGRIKATAKGAWDAAEHAARAATTTAQSVAQAAQRAALKANATARTVASATATAARRAVKAANEVATSVGRTMRGAGKAGVARVDEAVAAVRRRLDAFQASRAAESAEAARTFKGEPVESLPDLSAPAARVRAGLSEFDRRVLDRALSANQNGVTPLDALNQRLVRAPFVASKARWLDPGTKRVYDALDNIVKESRRTGNVVHGEFHHATMMSNSFLAQLSVNSKHPVIDLVATGALPPTIRTKEFLKGSVDIRDARIAAGELGKKFMGQPAYSPVIFRMKSRGAVPIGKLEALVTTPGARFLVKEVRLRTAEPFSVSEIFLEDISLTAQRRVAKVEATRDFAAENIRRAKRATGAVEEAEAVPMGGRLLDEGAPPTGRTTAAREALLKAIDVAKKNPGQVAGVAALAGSGALAGDDQDEAAAAAASVGLLTFFLPRGGKRLLGERLDDAFESLTARAKLRLRQATETVAKENEDLLRAFAAKRSPHKTAVDLLDEQFANYQTMYAKQNKIELGDIPDPVLEALEAELRFRNAALIESDPELLRLAEIGRFDLIRGEGKGVQGVPELRKFGLPEPTDVPITEGAGPPAALKIRPDGVALEIDARLEISPERALRNRRDRYNLAAEALQDGDLPQDAAQLLIDRRNTMLEDMPRGLGEGRMFGYVDDRLTRWKAAAEKRIGRPLNEREIELGESDFFYHATPRHAELARLDEALAKDEARLTDYKKRLDEGSPNPNRDTSDVVDDVDDGPAVMRPVDKEARKGWREAIAETRKEMEAEGFGGPVGAGFQPDEFDEAVNRIREKHIVDPNDEVYIRKKLGQEPPDMYEIDDWIDDAVNMTAGYHDYGTDAAEITADDIIRQIENGETRAGNVSLTPWEEYHIRERFDENAYDHQQRFDELIEEYHAESEAEFERENIRDAERRGMKRDRNEDGERYDDGRDGLPPEWTLENVGLNNVKVYDNAGVENVFGEGVTVRELRGMFALDELRQFAKQEGSELKTTLEVDTDKIFFDGSAGGGSFHVQGEISVPYNGRKGVPVARYKVLRVPEGSGFTREGVADRIRATLEGLNALDIAGLSVGGLALGAGAKALHDRAKEARDEVKAARVQMGQEADVVAALDRIDAVERTREKLGYLKTESDIVARDTARAIANPNARERTVAAMPGVTGSQGVARFLGSHASLREAYDDKRETLQKLQQNPMLLVDELTEGLAEVQEHAPGLHTKMVQQTYKVVSFLQSKLPSTIGASLTRPEGSPPNPLALRQFALYFSAATDPSSVMGDLSNNRARKEQVDTLREVWPDVYDDLKMRVVQQLSEGRPTIAQRTRLDLLFDLGENFDRGLSNRLVATLNDYRAQKGQGGEKPGPGGARMPTRRTQPSVGGSGALGALYLGPASGPGTMA